MMKNKLKTIGLVLLLVQLATLVYILMQADTSGWGQLLWLFLGSLVLVWFVGLMVFTFQVYYKGNEHSRKKDSYALIVIGVITFFSVMLTFGGIS